MGGGARGESCGQSSGEVYPEHKGRTAWYMGAPLSPACLGALRFPASEVNSSAPSFHPLCWTWWISSMAMAFIRLLSVSFTNRASFASDSSLVQAHADPRPLRLQPCSRNATLTAPHLLQNASQ